LRETEGGARAAQATVDELRVTLSRGEAREHELGRDLAEAQKHRTVAETQVGELRRGLDEQKAILASAEKKLGDTFRALAAEALAANNEGFLTLAGEKLGAARRETDASLEARHKAIEALLKPVRDSLEKVDGNIREIEKERGHAYGRLNALVTGLATSQDKLAQETENLVRALRAPAVRGRWGEIQLKRVVELAGMVEHCDFVQQETLETTDGRLRPDLIVSLPNGRHVVVDAKVPLEAYLAAVDAAADESLRREHLLRHADQVRAHVLKLSAKSYWNELSNAPEFVVMFLPSEGIYHAALQESPDLIEQGASRYAHDADRAVAGGPLRLAPGETGRKRPANQRSGARAARTAGHPVRSLRKARCGPGPGHRFLQRGGGLVRANGKAGGAQAGGTGRGGQEASGRNRSCRSAAAGIGGN
jgi:DNA recombination protein RmuC